uniref:Uncharacterized protein n=1 Tax=Marseillevirus LCMAC202 TaxID=2506606 RepID=A0A481YY22_9VIRU|nr:MAG: hypothetical protein LCMAC202_04600 [Marseillevirus LCMAC202]
MAEVICQLPKKLGKSDKTYYYTYGGGITEIMETHYVILHFYEKTEDTDGLAKRKRPSSSPKFSKKLKEI